MKVPLKWLKEYVDINVSQAELAEALTMAGSEVGEIKTIGVHWDNVIIASITAVEPHPNADRLRLATVDTGTEKETVVCGAPNLNIGDIIAFARLGAELTDPENGKVIRLKKAKIRGVESCGMICAEDELGISDNHEGIMVLPHDTPLGTPLADYMGDTVFDLDITPNRADCFSVIGIARETAALTGGKLHIPEISYEETGQPIDGQIEVEIADPDLCSRYCASLITGIKIAESPAWMQERLLACGMRPIVNIVDITNYVMMEYGQPLHSFDYDKIIGRKIIVRRATAGEPLATLDDVDRSLATDTLVIADAARAVAIAGVMGGANTEVTERTTSILLEAASFNPASIHYTGRNLGLTSEASMRFERGIQPGLTIPALRHATRLMLELGGGKVARGIADVYPGKKDPAPLTLPVNHVRRILGIGFSPEQITDSLTSLGFECEMNDKSTEVQAVTPYWRGDINRPVDLIEEVARVMGYDKIPVTLLSGELPHQSPNPVTGLKKKINDCLVGYGFQEVLTYSLNGLDTLKKLTPEQSEPEPMPQRLANPMTAEHEYLRPNLRINLLNALLTNRRYNDGGINIFEVGKVYLSREKDLPGEQLVLCGLMCGARVEKSWLSQEETTGFFDAKGVAEGLLDRLDIEADFEPGDDASFHPANQVAIVTGGHRLGVVGELHPKVGDAFEITEPVYMFEINVTALLSLANVNRMYQPLLRFPGTFRDMALVVDTAVTHRQIMDIIKGYPLVSEVKIFDFYAGKQITAGKKSMAYRVIYQSPTHTLTDEEVDGVQEIILNKLTREVGATLRS
ncbi:phenylalanine--tRNA ligase subunit beta [Chloroflexota bacterium]